MKIRKNQEKSGKIRKNQETGKISGKENNHKICEQKTIDSVKKFEDLMKSGKKPGKKSGKE